MSRCPPQTSGKRQHRSRWWWALLGVPVLPVISWFVIAQVYASPEPSAFYDPPSPLPSDPLGTVIRVEDVTAESNTMKVHRALYTSTDPRTIPSGFLAS